MNQRYVILALSFVNFRFHKHFDFKNLVFIIDILRIKYRIKFYWYLVYKEEDCKYFIGNGNFIS